MNDGNYFDDADQLSGQTGLGTRDSKSKQAALAVISAFEALEGSEPS